MKHLMLTSDRASETRNVVQMSDETFTRLTHNGPVLVLGVITLTESAFVNVAGEYIWRALGLHYCGHWGACERWEALENEEQLLISGAVMSRWMTEDTFEFTVETVLDPGQERTVVSVPPWSMPFCEAPSSLVPLGDVLLDDAAAPIPYTRIWSALEHHRFGSRGDLGKPTEDIGGVHVSWWGESSNGAWFHRPFWIITLLEGSPLTIVAGSKRSDATH